MWGLRLGGDFFHIGIRFIPTYVGFTTALPRPGSTAVRFIPTYVGFTAIVFLLPLTRSVHPHVRGVYGNAVAQDPPSGRFIPTHVRFTCSEDCYRWPTPVHPHIRGVYPPAYPSKVTVSGSSPRTRGLRLIPSHISQVLRFIPTYMGFTRYKHLRYRNLMVHPHIHGVYWVKIVVSCGASGSSPRMWGLPDARCRVLSLQRFIPTYVGFTSSHSGPSSSMAGSSPRMWGLRWAVP